MIDATTGRGQQRENLFRAKLELINLPTDSTEDPNFAITASLKFNRISEGARAMTPSTGGIADFSVGWADADENPATSRARAVTPVLFKIQYVPLFLCGAVRVRATALAPIAS